MDNKELTIDGDFSLTKAFLEITRIQQAEGAEQAGVEFIGVLSGFQDSIDEEELLKRFYLLSERLAAYNPDLFLQIVQKGSVLKSIFTSTGTVLSEKIDKIQNVKNESVYIVHFLKNKLKKILDSSGNAYSLSDELVNAGSVSFVLLRAIYAEYMTNLANLDKFIKRKEALMSRDLSDIKKEAELSLKNQLLKHLREIKSTMLADEYVDSLEKLQILLSSMGTSDFRDFSEIAKSVQALGEQISKANIDDISRDDSSVIDVTPESKCFSDETNTIILEKIENISQDIEMLSASSIKKDDSLKSDTLDAIVEIKNTLSEIKNIESKLNEDYIVSEIKKIIEESSLVQKQGAASGADDLEEFEILISTKFSEVIEHITSLKDSDSQASSNTVDEDSSVFSSIAMRINEQEESVETAIASAKSEILSKIEELKDVEHSVVEEQGSHHVPDYSSDIREMRESISELSIAITEISRTQEALVENTNSMMSILQSIGEDISSEIEIAKKFREGMKDEK